MRPLLVLVIASCTLAPALTAAAQPAPTTPAPAPAPATPTPATTATPTPTPAAAPAAAPAPPAPTAVATEDTVSADTGGELPFFPARAHLAPPPPPPEPDGFVLAAAIGFQQLMVLAAESSGTVVALGGYAGKRGFGFTFEYNNLAGVSGLSGGVSLGRFSNAVKLGEPGGFLLTLLGPTLDAKAKVFFTPEDPMFVATASVDLLGLRMAKCTGSSSFHVSVRGPTVGAGAVFMSEGRFEPDDEPLGAVVLGATLEAGLAF